ncbi:MAG: glutamate-5-semialdehyde dehydrogenase [Firmicutes bacterium]|jgi:glutamate-5-semialdehyde dehydrogenase|nr:glutamate-5-semialdehyde dehydrogenase [Bacillota bacterium]
MALDDRSYEEVRTKAELAKKASKQVARLSAKERNNILLAQADALLAATDKILEANRLDVARAKEKGATSAFVDRLSLSEQRVRDMATGLVQVADLPDPLGVALRKWRLPNGLDIAQIRVPLGVVAVIYEGRPNVTVDVTGLCIKSGNAAVLRGSSDAIESNKALVDVLTEAGEAAGCPHGAIQLIHSVSRESARHLMRMTGLVDVLIPRGGAGLISTVVENSTVPVIETGIGNCHIYVDAMADLAKASKIVLNAKLQRPGVCNAVETLLVHSSVAEQFLPTICASLREAGVELRGCPRTRALVEGVAEATDEDWQTEYLDLILAIRVVDSLDEAIEHIERYGSHHSDAIVTQDYDAARRFADEVDSAAVYVNASTRFTDGFEWGFGAEIGISTQKLHARGPMALPELTTGKYVVLGDGQVRG